MKKPWHPNIGLKMKCAQCGTELPDTIVSLEMAQFCSQECSDAKTVKDSLDGRCKTCNGTGKIGEERTRRDCMNCRGTGRAIR